jgi:hypothetical protein
LLPESCDESFATQFVKNQIIEANEAESSRMLGLLRDTPGLSFVVTSRVSLPGLVDR